MPDDLHNTILDLNRIFVSEALDIARVHLDWTQCHLAEGRDERAVASFERYRSASREAAGELKPIQAAIEDRDKRERSKTRETQTSASNDRRGKATPRTPVSVGEPAGTCATQSDGRPPSEAREA